MKHLILLAVFSLCLTVNMFSQQDPQYTQYMYNMNIVNPAYAGSNEALSIGILGRSQWVGIEGAPRTFTAALHTPISSKMGIGLSFIADKIGPVEETNAYADWSYTIQLSREKKLAFGLKAGATFFNLNLSNLQSVEDYDPLLYENINNIYPNIGAGAFYYTEKFYAGISMPNILKSKHFKGKDGISTEALEETHFFVTSGYVFDLSQSTKLKPSVMVKGVSGAPLSIDLSANALFNDKLELGLSYRLDDSVSGLVGFFINPYFRVGYAYDYTLSNLGEFNSGSHEIILTYSLVFTKGGIKSPRFF